jgi:gluconate 2-dehydrogenase gamma chain
MSQQELERRDFVAGVVARGVAAASTATTPSMEAADAAPATPHVRAQGVAYTFLNPDEARFVEALVDHMIPADDLTPAGTDLGIAIYIDRALAGAWGQGERLYAQGPWRQGLLTQGYQLPLVPAQLYRAGIAATDAHCLKVYGKSFESLSEAEREEVLIGLSSEAIRFDNGLPIHEFWTVLYQTVIEGLFCDPIHGGNRDRAGWRLIGFPGVIAQYRDDVETYRGKPYPSDSRSIADLS